jgi:hypothetical protein
VNLNRVYVAVWSVGFGPVQVELRQNRWTWRRARAERWAQKLRAKGLTNAHVRETRLL